MDDTITKIVTLDSHDLKEDEVGISSITLRRSGIWAEVLAVINGKEVMLIREVWDGSYHHTIHKHGMMRVLNRLQKEGH